MLKSVSRFRLNSRPGPALQGWKWLILAIAISLSCVLPSFGQDNFTLSVDSISRGETITINRDGPKLLPEKNPTAVLKLIGESGTKPLKLSGNLSDEQKQAFSFAIPEDFDLGSYVVRIDIHPGDQANAKPLYSSNVVVSGVPGKQLTINSALGKLSPRIQSIFPRGIFPEKDGTFSFDVVGSGFSPMSADNHLILSKKNKDNSFSPLPEISICWQGGSNCQEAKSINTARGTMVTPRQLSFANVHLNANEDHGDLGVQIRVGDQTSSPEYPITLSRVPKHRTKLAALVIFVLIVLLLIGIQSLRPSQVRKPILRTAFIQSLLVDPETQTLSLSRFQFILWSAVALASYLFLLFSLVFAQDRFDFVDIPDGLPGIVLISSSTTVFTAGISALKGNKGSAQLEPQWSDLYCAGGYVVPERLQFFVWTLLGAGVYLLLVLSQSAAEINALPTIPGGFLQLSGLSSLGYLGGRLARKPGPVITSMEKAIYDNNNKMLTLKIHGSNLYENSTLKMDRLPGPGKEPVIYIPKDQSATFKLLDSANLQDKESATLEIAIPSETNEWPAKDSTGHLRVYKMTIYNPDGQYAEWQFDGIS